MASKVLLALDESKNSMKAVEYVAKTMKTDSSILLMSILPDAMAACELDGPSLTPLFKQNRQAFCTIEDTKKYRVQEFMEDAKGVLAKAGFKQKKIAVKIQKRKTGIARDILKEAVKGKYDTVVVGRRGLTGVKEILLGSVSNRILHLAKKMTVIIVE